MGFCCYFSCENAVLTTSVFNLWLKWYHGRMKRSLPTVLTEQGMVAPHVSSRDRVASGDYLSLYPNITY
jgi:hypothetical protein